MIKNISAVLVVLAFAVVVMPLIFIFVYLGIHFFNTPEWKPGELGPQPPKEQLEKDGLQIAESFLNEVERYRHYLLSDTVPDKQILERLPFIYDLYVWRTTIDNEHVPTPMPMSTQLNVAVDTILYSKNQKFCFALLITEQNYSTIEGLQDEELECPFSGYSFIGYRKDKSSPYKIYPVTMYHVSAESYEGAQSELRNFYFAGLKFNTAGYFTVFGGTDFKYNIGDSLFFEKSPFFQKYDSTRYNFQMFRTNMGRRGDTILEYTTNEGM